jgi:hypothetical protein
MAEYRIVTDAFCGFEVQIRSWWWPFWVEADFCNTFSTIEAAERFAEHHARGCVKYLGTLEPACDDAPVKEA